MNEVNKSWWFLDLPKGADWMMFGIQVPSLDDGCLGGAQK